MRKVIMDVDTGSDDAVAILCAVLSGQLDVVGICTECLLPIQVTTDNTLKVLHLLGSKIPVYRGSHQAMVQNLNPLRKRKKVFNQPMVVDGKEVLFNAPANCAEAISAVQRIAEGFVKQNSGCKMDYIHGEDNLMSVAASKKGVAIIMPSLKKDELFAYVSAHGALCKKTFSMGEAQEKRYYVEAKRI